VTLYSRLSDEDGNGKEGKKLKRETIFIYVSTRKQRNVKNKRRGRRKQRHVDFK